MKNKLWLLSILGVIFFSACGGGSSKEAKELQQKMIKIVGIPQGIIANVCQDDNSNGFCEEIELQAKVTFDQGDTMQDILSKLTLTAEGRYLLETYDPSKPLLLELKDGESQYFTDSFTLPFNGFKNNEDEKELSILQSMVDKDAISNTVANKFRTLTNKDSQNKFYTTLLNDLENNINTLRINGLDSQKAVSATLKEMADETKINQEQADKINACGNDQTCVDREIKSLSDELIITEEESNLIVSSNNNENSQNNENQEVQQFGKWVTPSKSVCERSGMLYNPYGDNQCISYWEDAEKICRESGARLPIINELEEVVTKCGGIVGSIHNISNTTYETCYKKEGFLEAFNYLSSSNSLRNSDSVLSINFAYGMQYEEKKDEDFGYVRCVKN